MTDNEIACLLIGIIIGGLVGFFGAAMLFQPTKLKN